MHQGAWNKKIFAQYGEKQASRIDSFGVKSVGVAVVVPIMWVWNESADQ